MPYHSVPERPKLPDDQEPLCHTLDEDDTKRSHDVAQVRRRNRAARRKEQAIDKYIATHGKGNAISDNTREHSDSDDEQMFMQPEERDDYSDSRGDIVPSRSTASTAKGIIADI